MQLRIRILLFLIQKLKIYILNAVCRIRIWTGSRSGSGRMQNYLQDPDPERIRNKNLDKNGFFYLITMFIHAENIKFAQQ